jgi:anti-sigma factor RsiW
MNVVEFEDLLDRLGDDLSTWPLDRQNEARALLAQSAEAKELLREARAMRGLLARPPVSAPAGLADRIMTQAAHAPAVRKAPEKRSFVEALLGSIWPVSPAWRMAFLSVCFAIGVFGGIFHNMTRLDGNEVDFHDFVASIVDITYFKD